MIRVTNLVTLVEERSFSLVREENLQTLYVKIWYCDLFVNHAIKVFVCKVASDLRKEMGFPLGQAMTRAWGIVKRVWPLA